MTELYSVPSRICELVKAWADVLAHNNKGQTLLHVAAEGQGSDTAKSLLQCETDINVVNDDGQTPPVCLLTSYGNYLDIANDKCESSDSCYCDLPRLFDLLFLT